MLRHAPEVGGMAMSRVTNPEEDGDLLRRSQRTWKGISPEVAGTLYELGFSLDVTPLLERLTMPALVLHRRGSQAIPFELGRRLAAKLPDARFVPLDGDAHEPWDGDVQASLAAVADFLDVPLSLEGPRQQQRRAPSPSCSPTSSTPPCSPSSSATPGRRRSCAPTTSSCGRSCGGTAAPK